MILHDLYDHVKHLNLTIMERISRFTIYRENGCWEFHGKLNSQGYGQVEYQGRMQLVSRVSFRLMKGKIPKGKFVLHTCDNTRCYNPDHLFLGTQAENIADMIAKGRAAWQESLPTAVMKRRFL